MIKQIKLTTNWSQYVAIITADTPMSNKFSLGQYTNNKANNTLQYNSFLNTQVQNSYQRHSIEDIETYVTTVLAKLGGIYIDDKHHVTQYYELQDWDQALGIKHGVSEQKFYREQRLKTANSSTITQQQINSTVEKVIALI